MHGPAPRLTELRNSLQTDMVIHLDMVPDIPTKLLGFLSTVAEPDTHCNLVVTEWS